MVYLIICFVGTKYHVGCLVTELILLCRLMRRQLLWKIWQEQVLPIGNEQYSSLKSMMKEEVSATQRNCGSWTDGSVLSKIDEA